MELRRLIGYGNMISCLSTNDGVIKDIYSPTWYNTDAEQVSIVDNDRFGKVIDINNCEKGIYVSASDLKLYGIQEFTIGFWQNIIEIENSYESAGFTDDNKLTMMINAYWNGNKKCGCFKIGRSTSGTIYDVGVDFGNGTINIGEWAHYCVTKNKRGYRCYVNGKMVSTNYYDNINDAALRTDNLKYMSLSPSWSVYDGHMIKLHTQTYNFFMSSKGIDVTSFEITKPVIGLMYKEYDENGNIYSI